MNLNNVEALKAEMKGLKIPETMIKDALAEMEKGKPAIEFKRLLPADRGQLNLTLQFKKSGQSEYYFLNRYDLALSTSAKPLENDGKYLVMSPSGDKDNSFKAFDSFLEAKRFFENQKGKAELAIGKPTEKDMSFRSTIATMQEGKVDYVNTEHQMLYRNPALTHTFYVDKGKGFNIMQGANMLQGRAAYREDLVSRSGEGYKAWSTFQFDTPKDNYGNYKLKQFNENYGFDLEKSIGEYRIQQLDDPKKLQELMAELKDGNRPVVTVENEKGESQKLMVEAMPRYGNLNFFQPNGKPEKREQFLKEPKAEMAATQSQKKSKEQSQEMGL